jgi:hypothetical protein
MRVRVYTPAGDLGELRLAEGVRLVDVLDAMRGHRLYLTPAATPVPEAAGAPTNTDCHPAADPAHAHKPTSRRRGGA